MCLIKYSNLEHLREVANNLYSTKDHENINELCEKELAAIINTFYQGQESVDVKSVEKIKIEVDADSDHKKLRVLNKEEIKKEYVDKDPLDVGLDNYLQLDLEWANNEDNKNSVIDCKREINEKEILMIESYSCKQENDDHILLVPHSCNICYKTFTEEHRLKEHMKIHADKKIYCESCGKTFTKRSKLVIHERTHTGVKPYICNVCNKGFSMNHTLKTHLLIHTGERPFACDLCEKTFNDNSNLRRHKVLKHRGI